MSEGESEFASEWGWGDDAASGRKSSTVKPWSEWIEKVWVRLPEFVGS